MGWAVGAVCCCVACVSVVVDAASLGWVGRTISHALSKEPQVAFEGTELLVLGHVQCGWEVVVWRACDDVAVR